MKLGHFHVTIPHRLHGAEEVKQWYCNGDPRLAEKHAKFIKSIFKGMASCNPLPLKRRKTDIFVAHVGIFFDWAQRHTPRFDKVRKSSLGFIEFIHCSKELKKHHTFFRISQC